MCVVCVCDVCTEMNERVYGGRETERERESVCVCTEMNERVCVEEGRESVCGLSTCVVYVCSSVCVFE